LAKKFSLGLRITLRKGDPVMWTRALSALLLVILVAAMLTTFPPACAYANETGGSHEGSGAAAGPLDIQKSMSFWTGGLFVVLFIILYFVAWGPISSGLNKREKSIADQIAQAAEANKKAQELLAQHDKKLAETAQEVRAILDKARQDADVAAREREAKAEADAKARFERAEKEITAATSAAVKELADRSATLAVQLAGKIVSAKLNPKDHAQLIEQAVSGFTVSKTSGKFASRN
jgi:F-type H+-transporting ATPase subunit b